MPTSRRLVLTVFSAAVAVLLAVSMMLSGAGGFEPVAASGTAPATGFTAGFTTRTELPGGVLRVRVIPPPGRRGRVEVRGPAGFAKVLTKTTTLRRLAPGRYRVRGVTVSTRKWTSKPTVSQRAVQVTAKRGAHVGVSYAVAISTKVDVVKPAQIRAFAISPSGTGRLETRRELAAGDIVAAGVGAATPHGALVRVQDVISSGGLNTYAVRQARLDEALVAGEFDETFSVSLDEAPTPRSSRLARRGDARTRDVGCSVGWQAGRGVMVSGDVEMRVSGSWGNAAPSMTVSLTPYVSANVGTESTAAISCAAERTLSDKSFKPYTVWIGTPPLAVPLVIVPRLRTVGGVSLSSSRGFKVSGTTRLDANLTATATQKGIETSVRSPALTRSATAELHGNTALDLYAKTTITGELYGVGGPYGRVQVGVSAIAEEHANPWWHVDAYAKVGAGVEVEKCVKLLARPLCVSLSAGKDDIINVTLPIIAAGGPYGTAPTSPPTAEPTSTPTVTPSSTPTATPTMTCTRRVLTAQDGFGNYAVQPGPITVDGTGQWQRLDWTIYGRSTFPGTLTDLHYVVPFMHSRTGTDPLAAMTWNDSAGRWSSAQGLDETYFSRLGTSTPLNRVSYAPFTTPSSYQLPTSSTGPSGSTSVATIAPESAVFSLTSSAVVDHGEDASEQFSQMVSVRGDGTYPTTVHTGFLVGTACG